MNENALPITNTLVMTSLSSTNDDNKELESNDISEKGISFIFTPNFIIVNHCLHLSRKSKINDNVKSNLSFNQPFMVQSTPQQYQSNKISTNDEIQTSKSNKKKVPKRVSREQNKHLQYQQSLPLYNQASIKLFLELFPHNVYSWNHKMKKRGESVNKLFQQNLQYYDSIHIKLDYEHLFLYNADCNIFVRYSEYDSFLKQNSDRNKPSSTNKKFEEYVRKTFGHDSYNKLLKEIQNIQHGLWICFKCTGNLIYCGEEKKDNDDSRHIVIYGNYLEYFNKIIPTDDFAFAKLSLSAYWCHYIKMRIESSQLLHDFFKIERHCYDNCISESVKSDVFKMYQKYYPNLTDQAIVEHHKQVGYFFRSKYFFRSPEKLQTLFHDTLFNKSCDFNLQICTVHIFLLFILIKVNKELLWNTSLQHAQFPDFNWQQQIVNAKGESFLNDLRSFGLFEKRLRSFKQHNISEWCTFLNYWLKHDNSKYPNFFAKLELIMEIYPDICSRLFEVFDYICKYFESLEGVLNACNKNEELKTIFGECIESWELHYDTLTKECQLYQSFKNAFNQDTNFIRDIKIVMFTNKKQIFECIKYLAFNDIGFKSNNKNKINQSRKYPNNATQKCNNNSKIAKTNQIANNKNKINQSRKYPNNATQKCNNNSKIAKTNQIANNKKEINQFVRLIRGIFNIFMIIEAWNDANFRKDIRHCLLIVKLFVFLEEPTERMCDDDEESIDDLELAINLIIDNMQLTPGQEDNIQDLWIEYHCIQDGTNKENLIYSCNVSPTIFQIDFQ